MVPSLLWRLRAHTICFLASLHGQRCRLIGGALHLADVPVSGQIAQVHGTHVGAVTFYLLQVPQGEGVIVTVAEDDTVGSHTRQVVAAEVACCGATAAVVVVPRLAYHLQGNEDADERSNCCDSGGHATVAVVGSQGFLVIGLLAFFLDLPYISNYLLVM